MEIGNQRQDSLPACGDALIPSVAYFVCPKGHREYATFAAA
jgi:hypothetical protein